MSASARYALVAEDDLLQRSLMKLLLQQQGYEVLESEYAETAYHILRQLGASVSLLVCDVKLAGRMCGDKLAHLAKSEFPSTKVIVVSGFGRPVLPTGVAFLSKPFKPLDLVRLAADRPRYAEESSTVGALES